RGDGRRALLTRPPRRLGRQPERALVGRRCPRGLGGRRAPDREDRAPAGAARDRGARLRPSHCIGLVARQPLGWAAVATPTRFDDLALDELRARRSVKWRRYPDDVLPAWVAELDFPLAPPVHRVLVDAVARSDTGYANVDGLPAAFAEFAAAR